MAPMPGLPGMDPSSAPGGAPPPGGPPALPKSLAGAPPTGPGSSPALSPGDGAGKRAASVNQIRQIVIPTLHVALQSFDPGSKEYQGLMRALSAVSPLFGKGATGQNMLPASVQAMVQNAGMAGGGGGMPPGGPPAAGKPPPSLGPMASESAAGVET